MRIAFTWHPFNVNWNHGAAVLSAICNQSGIETELVPLHEGFTGIGFDWVCCSFVTVHDYLASVSIVSKIEVPKIAGGVYARKGGRIEGFDHVCRGEGSTLVDFFLHGDTTVFDKPMLDTDINIMPDYSSVTGYEFGRGLPWLEGRKLVPYSHSRGCPYQCSFCEVRNLDQRIRIKTNIKQDLRQLGHYNPDLFYFTDELLPYYNRGWREQMEGNQVPFLCFIRGDIQPSHLDFLIDNGAASVVMGVESGDEQYRNNQLNKRLTDKQLYRTVKQLDKRGVHRLTLFMRNTPGETNEMRDATYDMVETLGGDSIIFEYEAL